MPGNYVIVGISRDLRMIVTSSQNRRASIKDVARLAGVSSKTVSNVIHGYRYLSASTRERVESAIKELDYRPDLNARSLRTGRTGLVALSIPALDVPYYAELASLVVRSARQQDLTILIDETADDPGREVELLTGLGPRLTDGVICTLMNLSRPEIEDLHLDPQTPIVLLGETVLGLPLDHVLIDNIAAAREATEHLIALGRRRIAAIGVRRDDLRLEGYRQALDAAGLPIDEHLEINVPNPRHSDQGADGMRQLLALDEPPDAVFCLTDLLAFGALRVLHKARISVPEQIAVVGFDDLEAARHSVPTLSSIAPDKAEIARAAVERIQLRVANPSLPAETIVVPHRLVIRESTVG